MFFPPGACPPATHEVGLGVARIAGRLPVAAGQALTEVTMQRMLRLAALLMLLAGCAIQAPERGPLTEGAAADPERDLLVTILPGAVPAAAVFRTLADHYGMELRAAWPIAPLGVVCAVLRAAGPAEATRLRARLADDPRIEAVQPLNLFRTSLAEPLADPLYPLQPSAARMNLDAAHALATGRGVRVAVIDSGIDAAHEDLAGGVLLQRDLVAARPAAASPERHGTAMAGIIGARAANRRGIRGVAPDAALLGLRACWEARPDEAAICSSFTLARAVSLAITERAAVLNLSLTGPHDPLLARLIAAAVGAGMVVVAADSPGGGFPAGLAGVIAAGGPESTPPTVAAPAWRVLTTVPGGYDFLSGVSVAAAHVSGLAALIRERSPGADGSTVRAALRDAASSPSGLPDACRALAAGPCPPQRL